MLRFRLSRCDLGGEHLGALFGDEQPDSVALALLFGAVGKCGVILLRCHHDRFESFEQLNAGTGPALDEATATADREQAGQYLEAASAAGIGPASFNLAGLYVGGYGGGSWEDRKARAADMYALAYAQGFIAFGCLMHGTGPGQPYLSCIEGHGITGDQSTPPQ